MRFFWNFRDPVLHWNVFVCGETISRKLMIPKLNNMWNYKNIIFYFFNKIYISRKMCICHLTGFFFFFLGVYTKHVWVMKIYKNVKPLPHTRKLVQRRIENIINYIRCVDAAEYRSVICYKHGLSKYVYTSGT